ncbi:hypothetical protein [Moorena sp. SIOASIH]|nr:hypothetical protein [Moorena sp. SIOASIH]
MFRSIISKIAEISDSVGIGVKLFKLARLFAECDRIIPEIA